MGPWFGRAEHAPRARELAARSPALPRALVLVDPGPIDPRPETVKTFIAGAEQLAGPAGEDVRRAWVEDFGTLDEKLAQSIADLMCGVPLQIATQMIEGLNSWTGVGAMALCGVPTLMIRAGLSDHPDALRLREIKPDLQVGITVGAGDFHQLEVPDQVNAMIERFLELAC